MALDDPRPALTELVSLCSALKLPSDYGAAVPMFEAVKIFDLTNLKGAFDELLVYKNRCAFVIHETLVKDSNAQGEVIDTEQALDVSIVFTDRRYVDRTIALMGDANVTPGVLQMATILCNGVRGRMPTTRYLCLPGHGHLVDLQGSDRANDPGRLIFLQEVTINMGNDRMELGRGARLRR